MIIVDKALRARQEESVGLERVLAEGSGEEATSVLSPLKVDYVRSAELGLSEDHD